MLEHRNLLASDLVITEFMAANAATLADEDGESSDWIEVHNPSPAAIDLSDWSLSDEAGLPRKWSFPAVELGAGEFLVVFASGKNRRSEAGSLHTNFKLSNSGEYLGLARPDGTVAHEFAPVYPPQQVDVSYGPESDAPDAMTGYMTEPTPGAANAAAFLGFVANVTLGTSGGFFDEPFQLEISQATADAEIRYTTDGSPPTAATGENYVGAITIDSTTTLRAAAFKPGYVPSKVRTGTYIFLADVLQQTQPESYPDLRSGDYDVDPEIALGGQYHDRLLAGLREVPSLSLVLPIDDFVGRRGIYANPTARGDAWERATSVELIKPDGTSTPIDAGLRIQGGASRNPGSSPKHSFSLRFRNEYGVGQWELPLFDNSPVARFDSLSLRAGSNNSWISDNAVDRRHAQMIRDQWVRDSLLDMGHIDAGRGSFVHVYVNGLYWGVYNLTERPDAAHYANYFGGDADNYDAFNGNQVIDGGPDALNAMKAIAAAGDWERLQQVLDVDRYIDYTIINRYGANGDLDANRNYRLAGGGPDQAVWRLYPWDSEEVLISSGSTGRPTDPLGIRIDVEKMPEFLVRFADRIQKHLFSDGALTPDKAAERWQARADELDLAIIGESARWGDHRRPDRPYDRDVDWLTEQNRLLKEYFPQRTRVLLDVYREGGLFPRLDAPRFNQHGGLVADTFEIQLTVDDEAVIYYTTDGSDPRRSGGAVGDSAQVFAAPVRLSQDATLKARALQDGQWSALSEADFTVASKLPLRVTELNVNPHAARLVDGLTEEMEVANERFEFIELTNVGDQEINLAEVRLVETVVDFAVDGITFVFADQLLRPGQRTVVVRDRAAFESRYGSEVLIASGVDGVGGFPGQYRGDLRNEGERITLVDAEGTIIQRFDYSLAVALHARTSGRGSSLEAVDPLADDDDPFNWRASGEFGGSPGAVGTASDGRVVINELLASETPDGDGWVELHNSTTEQLDIGRWYLSNSATDLFKFSIEDAVTIPAHGFYSLDQSQLGFGFDRARGGDVWLIQADSRGVPLRFADHVKYSAGELGIALGRSPAEAERMIAVSRSTINAENGVPEIGDVIISEVSFRPPDLDGIGVGLAADDFEYIELFNRSDVEVDVSGWKLAGDVDLTIRRGTIIPPGQTIVAIAFSPNRSTQADPFRNAYGIDRSVSLVGPWVGHLGDARGTIRLERPTPPTAAEPFFVPFAVVDEVTYSAQPPWPASPGGGGQTLARAKADGLGNLAAHWNEASPTPGSSDLTVRRPGDANGDGRFDSTDLVFAMQSGKFGTGTAATFAEGDWNRDGLFDLDDLATAAANGQFER